MLTYEQQITALYIGYFNRAPDAEGLAYWLGKANSGVPMRDIAASFISSPEAIRNYPDLRDGIIDSPDNFITTVYRFAFDRYPDAGGAAYWLSKIQAGTPVKDAMYDILFTASGFDELRLNNKVEVGIYFAKEVDEVGKPFDIAKANAFIDNVDSTSGSVAKAKADVDIYLHPPVVEQPDPNTAPVATTDTLSVGIDRIKTISSSVLLANDTDAEGDTISIVSVQDAVNGTVSLDNHGNVIFTPDAGYAGDASFTYTITDGKKEATGNVDVTVYPEALVNFDDLPTLSGSNSSVPAPYHGLTFTNLYYYNSTQNPGGTGGYPGGIHSGAHAVFNTGNSQGKISADTSFDLESAYMSSAWDNSPATVVTVKGFKGGTEIGSQQVTLNFGSATLVQFDNSIFDDVDEVTFTSSVSGNGHFTIDDITIVGIPVT